MRQFPSRALFAVLLFFGCLLSTGGQRLMAQVPHGQHKVPGPALEPEEARSRMTVPPGFSVEVVAAEPDIVNPVAMTFDERGRVWITESFEYPRREAGPGRDRIKVLEDTDRDGRLDKVTVFADGLNIPSGIAVGYGGVWVANAPDILFLQDTDGDDRADRREVVITGFGRDDTHELPNSLTWGPDGWLYGLNGVFNRSIVANQGRELRFTAAMFRIEPRTRRFELFAEGTSNPWGIAWDSEGSAFVSACVIDHLWHLVETGYYHRQAGAYPESTWRIESIVKHKHQQAAYCGIHCFDSDAYPEEYRGRLYMGNIHGNCINSDSIARDGATYAGSPQADFLSANDAWFMPVVQKTGPDGCLYVLDWYDRYHCYQDAGRDPAGIDRGRGRLYRVRYKDSPRAEAFDLTKETDAQLVARLHSPNVYFRDLAQRLLAERTDADVRPALEKLVLDDAAPRPARLHGLWALVARGPLDVDFHAALLTQADPTFRAWGVRAAGNQRDVAARLREKIATLATDPAPEVRLQVAIVAPKISALDSVALLVRVLAASGDDTLIPRIVWQNLYPQLDEQGDRFFAAIEPVELRRAAGMALIVPRVCERLLTRPKPNTAALARLLSLYLDPAAGHPETANQCLRVLASRIQNRELSAETVDSLRTAIGPQLRTILTGPADGPCHLQAALLAVSWQDPQPLPVVRQVLLSHEHSDAVRAEAFAALETAGDAELLTASETLLVEQQETSAELRRRVLTLLERLDQPRVAEITLRAYSDLQPELRPHAISLLTSRPAWGRRLLVAIGEKQIAATDVNTNQIRKLLAGGDDALRADVIRLWGTLRTERNPDREQTISRVRQVVRSTPGNPQNGAALFQKTCGVCHKLYGNGQDVGPDITVNGRGSFEQLLSNVLDPSLVIGAAYQARTIVTDDGRILTGLLVEDSPQRVVLKQQGGKVETIPRSNIVEFEVSKLSLMPEDLEKQLSPQELADLFTFLALDRPVEDAEGRWLSGFDGPAARESNK